MARYKLGGGYGAGSGLIPNGANLDNQFSVGKAGGQTLLFGTASTNNGVLSTNPSQDGQIFFGTMTAPSYWVDTTTALGADLFLFRSGKNGGGRRQILTLANRGSSIGDDVSIGLEPVLGNGTAGGLALSKTRIDGNFVSPNNYDVDFLLGIAGTATSVLKLDGTLGIARLVRGLQLSRIAKTGAYAMTDAETFVTCDATGGAFDLTLPTAVGRAGQVFGVKRISAANTVTIKSAGGTLDGVAAATGIGLTVQYQTRWYISDGTNYHTIMGFL